jgi:hypothetical protein
MIVPHPEHFQLDSTLENNCVAYRALFEPEIGSTTTNQIRVPNT